jgi:hypothetical protein
MKTAPFSRVVLLGLGLLLLVTANVRADGELGAASMPVDPLWGSCLPGEPGGLWATAEDPNSLFGTARTAGGEVQVGGDAQQAVPSAECPLGNDPVKLAGPPATLLLMFQGLLCIGLIRSRRKWAAALLAVVTIGRAGLEALPELVGLPKAEAASAAAASEAATRLSDRPVLPSTSPGQSYAGLLRRLDGDAASANAASLAKLTNLKPATSTASRDLVAGFSLLPAVTSPEALLPPAAGIAFLPADGGASLPPQQVCFALFARPPPFRAHGVSSC